MLTSHLLQAVILHIHVCSRLISFKLLFYTYANVSSRRGGGAVGESFASQADGWVFESQPRQTQVVKTGSAKRSALHEGVSVTGTWR